jgi:hypothetical protein
VRGERAGQTQGQLSRQPALFSGHQLLQLSVLIKMVNTNQDPFRQKDEYETQKNPVRNNVVLFGYMKSL